jgi:hypothetical protein
MTDKYWALVDLRYPAGDDEYAKAMKGAEYEEVVVKAGEPLTRVSEESIKALLSMGREVITTKAPPPVKAPVEDAEQTKAVKA